ncbi:MAG: hypothetical protein U0R70_10440 [Solirubrobacteraceae bacterium]
MPRSLPAAAFVWDRGEHAAVAGALGAAGIEALAVVGCFLGLGPALGLWRPSRDPRPRR